MSWRLEGFWGVGESGRLESVVISEAFVRSIGRVPAKERAGICRVAQKVKQQAGRLAVLESTAKGRELLREDEDVVDC